jgi:hypothetical protein
MIDDYSISKLEPFSIMDITYKVHWSVPSNLLLGISFTSIFQAPILYNLFAITYHD